MIKTFLALFVLLFSSSVFAGCTSGDCVNGFGTYTYADGNKYVGAFTNDSIVQIYTTSFEKNIV